MPRFSEVLPGPLRRLGRSEGPSTLPTYEKLRSPTKERFTEGYSDYSEYDGDDEPETPPSFASSYYSRSTDGSRQSSCSESSVTAMLAPQKRALVKQRVRRIYPYRLPNRPARYLSCIIISSLIFMACTLVRASRMESAKLARGDFKKLPPEPPTWEKFPKLSRYYGGIRTLLSAEHNEPEYPRAVEEHPAPTDGHHRRGLPPSKSFVTDNPSSIFATSSEELTECFLDIQNTVRVPSIRYFDGRPKGFPEHVIGSYDMLSLPEDICFDRFGRYGPYGMGYSARQGGIGRGEIGDTEGAGSVWASSSQIDYRKVDWADAQRRCYQANAARYKAIPARKPESRGFFIDEKPPHAPSETRNLTDRSADQGQKAAASESKVEGRTALVLRCWDDMEWQADEIIYVRSLISELSLASGGRYDVHLLVQVKDEGNNPIWADPASYDRVIRERIPREFRGLVTLWTQTQMLALYQGVYDLYVKGPNLPVHGPYRGLQMAMQHFAHIHPEYEYFWHWEMDIRYTGHYYDFFTKIENWSRDQPRKGLWERNARFYVPSVHGSWDEFKQLAKIQTEMARGNPSDLRTGVPGMRPGDQVPEKIVWGPERPADEDDWFEYGEDPTPPTSQEQDMYAWGVGEEADLISFMPIFDPEGTTWGLADDITGYNNTQGRPPRRAHINTASRMSRRLLTTMHRETTFKKHFAFPEMWPATVALQHGYKAVYVPHPSYVDRQWPTGYFAQVLNGGRNGASGGSRSSVFGQKEHNLHGLSWFYRSDFAPDLYRAWLGFEAKYGGGEDFELKEKEGRGGEGRMCLPPMLLHPIKNVGMIVEAPPEEEMEILEDPNEESEFDVGS
ncbi:hypothetical protein jhhlp_007303 [Lomentospora prolificans]|uniref:Glycosyl transferase CAP10 domain-containing protein n=1 Tax=Lomentospora prolificans TaxID=41688 RepID=A0A2N3N294_9PEZI|nr:hypothetical protein jhhlp_007303 [Lomentospora prolificans]